MDNLSQNAIGFHVVGNAAETRATPITPSNLETETDFDVFAYTADGTAFMGKADEIMGHSGVKIKHNGENWDYADQNDVHYWPTESLDFYAISPGSYSINYMIHYAWSFNHNSQQIHYSCMDEYGTGEGKHADHDVMYGIAKNRTKDMNNGVVKFTFKHILSQVVFKAKTELATMNVIINDIKIKNVKMSGYFTLPSTDIAPTSANWNVVGVGNTKIGTYSPTVIGNAGKEVESSINATDISSNAPLFTIPQTLTAWGVENAETKTKANADDAGQSYLEISCKIQQSGVYLCGSADRYGTIYVPFGASWEPGKRYIYTMIFGGGYDENGNEILKPIEFDAETTDWVDDAGNDHEVNM